MKEKASECLSTCWAALALLLPRLREEVPRIPPRFTVSSLSELEGERECGTNGFFLCFFFFFFPFWSGSI